MAFTVRITDKIQKDSLAFYTVSSINYPDTKPFKISINPVGHIITIFKDLDTAVPIKSINLFSDEIIGKCDGIPGPIISIIIKKVYRCIQNNDFPSDISFCA
jgi:hypothetical protein